MDTSSLGAAALEKLKGAFPAERWVKVEQQAAHHCGLDAEGLQGLCARLIATSYARHPDNDSAALFSAANRLLLSVGSTLKADDVERFELALKRDQDSSFAAPLPRTDDPAPAPPKPKRGGKADPAPPAQ